MSRELEGGTKDEEIMELNMNAKNLGIETGAEATELIFCMMIGRVPYTISERLSLPPSTAYLHTPHLFRISQPTDYLLRPYREIRHIKPGRIDQSVGFPDFRTEFH